MEDSLFLLKASSAKNIFMTFTSVACQRTAALFTPRNVFI